MRKCGKRMDMQRLYQRKGTGNAFTSLQVYQNDKIKLKFGKGKRFESDEEMHAACAVNMHRHTPSC